MTMVEFKKKENVAEVLINRPESLNALNHEVLDGIKKVFQQIEQDLTIKVVVVKGKGDNFVAGADIGMIEKANSYLDIEQLINGTTIFDQIENCTRPVIAVIKGFAMGGGCELALAADLRYASDDAKFALPEIKLGFIPGGGGTQRLPRLVGLAWSKELLFTGKTISANEAYRIGLVNKVVSSDLLEQEVDKLINILKDRPPLALRLLKSCVNKGYYNDKELGLEFERRCFASLMFTDDKKEGIRAFKEKRAPKFYGS